METLMKKNKLILSAFILLVFYCIEANTNWRHIERLPGTNGGVERQICLAPDYCLIINYSKILYLSRNQGLTWDSIYKFNYQFHQLQTVYPSIDIHYYYYWRLYKDTDLYVKQIHKYTDNYKKKEEVLYRDTSSQERIFWAPYMLNNDTGFAWCDEIVDRYESGEPILEHFILVTYDGWKTYKRREVPLYFWNSHAFHTRSDKSNLLCNSIYPYVQIKGDDTVKGRGIIVNYNFYEDEWTLLHAFPVPEEEYTGPFSYGPYYVQMLNDSVGFGMSSHRATYEPGEQRNVDIVYRTRDGGKSWKRVMDTLRASFPSDIQDIGFYDENNGVVVGRNGKVLMTNDGGESWYMDDPKQFKKSKVLAVMSIDWAGQFPIVGTRLDGDVYRYEGNFFKFDFKPPDLFFPRQNAIGIEPNVLFRWEELRDATNYEFQLATDVNFENIILTSSGKKMQIQGYNLEYFKEYWWRVSSSNGIEELWSHPHKFRIKIPNIVTQFPECNSLQSPENIKLLWSSVKGAEYYRLRISDTEDFANIIVDEYYLKDTILTVAQLHPNTNYYWQVQAYRKDESGDWSDVCNFKTTSGANVPINPQNIFAIHPNPATDYVYINLNDLEGDSSPSYNSGSGGVKIYNTLGQCVSHLTPTLSKGEGGRIDVSQLPVGVYLVRFGNRAEKFVKW